MFFPRSNRSVAIEKQQCTERVGLREALDNYDPPRDGSGTHPALALRAASPIRSQPSVHGTIRLWHSEPHDGFDPNRQLTELIRLWRSEPHDGFDPNCQFMDLIRLWRSESHDGFDPKRQFTDLIRLWRSEPHVGFDPKRQFTELIRL